MTSESLAAMAERFEKFGKPVFAARVTDFTIEGVHPQGEPQIISGFAGKADWTRMRLLVEEAKEAGRSIRWLVDYLAEHSPGLVSYDGGPGVRDREVADLASAYAWALRREANAAPHTESPPEPWREVLVATAIAAKAAGCKENKTFRRKFVETGFLSPADPSDRPHRFRAGELFDAL